MSTAVNTEFGGVAVEFGWHEGLHCRRRFVSSYGSVKRRKQQAEWVKYSDVFGMRAPVDLGLPRQQCASRGVAGLTGKAIWLESHSRRFAQQRWRNVTESVSEDKRGLVMYRRYALQMDGSDAGFRSKVQYCDSAQVI